MLVMTVTTMIGSATLSTFSPVTVIGTPPLQTIEFFVANPILSDLAVFCRLGLKN